MLENLTQEQEDLYETAPSDVIFEDLKRNVINLRIELDPEFHHKKTELLERLMNVGINFMDIMATLDVYNQETILERVTMETKEALLIRAPQHFATFEAQKLFWKRL